MENTFKLCKLPFMLIFIPSQYQVAIRALDLQHDATILFNIFYPHLPSFLPMFYIYNVLIFLCYVLKALLDEKFKKK